jgi:16S rRNA (cytidine1402-2'-O)-methyltransferase
MVIENDSIIYQYRATEQESVISQSIQKSNPQLKASFDPQSVIRNPQSGTLYIVSTPIGNLDDISARAVRILSEVDLIAAEDTRTTKILLDRFHIAKNMTSYHNYNERQRTPELIQKLKSGISIALVSDAGTPAISDPGYFLLREAIREGLPVVAIPGPSAFLAALIVSGAPTDKFVFEGFLPHKKGRKTKLEQLSREDRTIVLYESPHRLNRTLRDIHASMGNRFVMLAREFTKKFEETQRGSVLELLSGMKSHTVRGEFVIVVFPP